MITETALSAPIRFGSSAQPPQPGTSPRKTSGSENAGMAFETVRYAQCRPTSTPPPIAAPL